MAPSHNYQNVSVQPSNENIVLLFFPFLGHFECRVNSNHPILSPPLSWFAQINSIQCPRSLTPLTCLIFLQNVLYWTIVNILCCRIFFQFQYSEVGLDPTTDSCPGHRLVWLRCWCWSTLAYDRRNKNVFSLCRKVNRDVAVVMSSGSEFHSLAPMTGKARSPSVECRVAGTTKAAVDAERSLYLGRRSDTLVNSLEK